MSSIHEDTVIAHTAHQLKLLGPYVPTYIHLILSALFPIYCGAHASLSRPSSAETPPKHLPGKEKSTDSEDDDVDESPAEAVQRMEGFSPSDAILYPVLAGCMLGGLYFLIKWLKDPTILNTILNWYLSIFGAFSIARLLTDSTNTVTSFIYPSAYTDGKRLWIIKRKQKLVRPQWLAIDESADSSQPRLSPLPGPLALLRLSKRSTAILWRVRDLLLHPLFLLEAHVRGTPNISIQVRPQDILGVLCAITAVLWFNLISKPWWLTNLLGFSFCYNALQLMSPTTFWTGTMLLVALFAYDVYFVFYTPMMITVATKLDIPAKLLFPRPSDEKDDPTKQALSMLGLGDVVLPGIMIGLALRFDLYLFYLRKQVLKEEPSISHEDKPKTEASVSDSGSSEEDSESFEFVKPTYYPATGRWGDRFWLGSTQTGKTEGGRFPKTYFHASIIGYVIGLVYTLGFVHVYQHGQPALLYLVPWVLTAIWATAFAKGDVKTMWEYTEAEDGEEDNNEKSKRQEKAEDKKESPIEGTVNQTKEADEEGKPYNGLNKQAQEPSEVDHEAAKENGEKTRLMKDYLAWIAIIAPPNR
ncbi:hypothetical protein MMC25_008217 [Agyrium rufum]|nr:hypothetical protein [Agyrium rufum]